MMNDKPFKERVKETLIVESKQYKNNFVDYDYLICSKDLSQKDYYYIKAEEDNYLHLTGVNTSLSAQDFSDKCYSGELQENDFDFIKNNGQEDVTSLVRKKIAVLPGLANLFGGILLIEESFKKNKIKCAIALADNSLTLGFVDLLSKDSKARPNTLMKKNELNKSKSGHVYLVLRKQSNKLKFSDIIVGDVKELLNYELKIRDLLDSCLMRDLLEYMKPIYEYYTKTDHDSNQAEYETVKKAQQEAAVTIEG